MVFLYNPPTDMSLCSRRSGECKLCGLHKVYQIHKNSVAQKEQEYDKFVYQSCAAVYRRSSS